MELTEELSIGAFSRVSGLTVKALRHYDEIGLLEPARVDSTTAYRYYGLEQARTAEAIRRLRALEVPLDEIRELLGADEPVVRERLAVHRARLEGRAVETKRILDELDRNDGVGAVRHRAARRDPRSGVGPKRAGRSRARRDPIRDRKLSRSVCRTQRETVHSGAGKRREVDHGACRLA